MNRVLLTGATGFIGRQCIPSLLANGDEVHAVSSSVRQESSPGVYWHHVDLLDPAQITSLVRRVHPTHLLHFAWVMEPGTLWDSVDNFRWVQATLTLMQVFVESGGERMVMAGTCAEYDWRYGYCSESVTPLFPQSVYGTCKNALCTMVDALTKKTGVHAAWGRIFYLYGPHEHPERLVPFVIRSVMQRVRVPCSHGNQIRDYLHVEDVADAFVSLLKSNVTGVINIGSGCPTSLKSIIYRIAKDLDGENLIELGAKPTPVGDPPFLVADVARLTHELGWHPKYDLARGLEQTVNWWRHQLNKS